MDTLQIAGMYGYIMIENGFVFFHHGFLTSKVLILMEERLYLSCEDLYRQQIYILWSITKLVKFTMVIWFSKLDTSLIHLSSWPSEGMSQMRLYQVSFGMLQ